MDVLVVAAAGGSGTQKLVSREVIDALGPRGYLINIARGSVVDEEALVSALVEGRLAGAGLDVFADEPNVPEPLLSMDNVVVLPHVASGTVETRAAMEALDAAQPEHLPGVGAARHAGAHAGRGLGLAPAELPASERIFR